MAKSKLNLTITPLPLDLEKLKIEDAVTPMSKVKMSGKIPSAIAFEIAAEVGRILKKYDQKITEK